MIPSLSMRNIPGVCRMPYFLWKSESISGSQRCIVSTASGIGLNFSPTYLSQARESQPV